MQIEDKILEGIKNLIKQTVALQNIKIVKVKSIDKDNNIITATTDEEVDIDGIRIGVVESGEIAVKKYPAKDSLIAIASVENSEADYIMIVADEIESVEIKVKENIFKVDLNGFEMSFKNSKVKTEESLISFNGGEFGGLIKIEKMVDWMVKVYNDLQTLKSTLASITAVSTIMAPAGTAGGPCSGLLSINFNPNVPNPKVADFENEKVKH